MSISSVLQKHASCMYETSNHMTFSSTGDSLAQAILPDVYKSNVVMVNSLISSVLDSKLPTLTLPPNNWSEFCKTYIEAQSDALVWVNQVVARLDNVPQDVQSYHQDITNLFDDAISMVKCMVNNPERRSIYVSLLNQDLTIIDNKLNMVFGFVKGTVDALVNFKNILPEMAQRLQNLADLASQEEKVDQQKIAELKKAIDELNNDIRGLTASIVGLGIADAAAISLGTLATIVAFPIGSVVWLFCAPAIAVATTFIILDSLKIKEDKAKIEASQREMDQRTQDVSTLHLLAQNYSELAKSAESVQDNLEQILDNWSELTGDFSESIKNVQEAALDAKNCNDNEIINDLTLANSCWQQAYKDAGSLTIKLNHSDAVIEIGMS